MKIKHNLLILIAVIAILFASCNPPKGLDPDPAPLPDPLPPQPDPKPYVLNKEDIKVEQPAGGMVAHINTLFKLTVTSVSDDKVSYLWILDGEQIAQTKNLEYMFDRAGQFALRLQVKQDTLSFDFDFTLTVEMGTVDPPAQGATAYITKVLDFMPAVGQFTNTMPKYEQGDTQLSMNAKVLAAIGNNKRSMISLGGFGGYVVVGFDHTIQNVEGKCDFRVLGNAFTAAANPDPDAPEGGSCEPGVIMVAYDANSNGVPDDNEWYEIAGSSHIDPIMELWYEKAKKAGNNVSTYTDYQITYFRPSDEPQSEADWATYIKWEDNKGNTGYVAKNMFYSQPYFPLWATGDKLTFSGTCLPQNGVDEGEDGSSYFVLYKFRYGYADNAPNDDDNSAIDISWAINEKGQKVNLPGVDFIKIYTGVNQENGWLGECSTEITGIVDLHILDISIDSQQ